MSSVKRANTTGSKSVEQLLEDRRNLLVQLYCISQITELKSVDNHERIGKEIDQFLEQHELVRGKPIDTNALPKFRPRDVASDRKLNNRSKSSSPAEAKRDLKKQRSKDASPSASEEQEMEGQALPQSQARAVSRTHTQHSSQQNSRQPVVQTQTQTPSSRQLQQQLHRQQLQKQQLQKRRSVSPYQKVPITSDVATHPATQVRTEAKSTQYPESQFQPSTSEKRLLEEARDENTDNHTVKRPRLDSATYSSTDTARNEHAIELSPTPYSQMPDISQLHADPTPIEVKEPQPYIIESIIKSETKNGRQTFFENDINVREAVYMIMRETAPSKLAKGMPIQEIKYLSQTLPLLKLIPQSQKALSTDLINTALNERRITVVASRIEELKRLNLWSLRQPKKYIDPVVPSQPKTHRSVMIDEAKWMREDFRESLHYKIAMCTQMAQAVMDFWAYGKMCCVQRKDVVTGSAENEHVASSQDMGTNIDIIDPEGKEAAEIVSSEKPDDKADEVDVDDKLGNDTQLSPDTLDTNESAEANKESDIRETDVETQNEVEEPAIDTEKLLKRVDLNEEIVASSLPVTSMEVYLTKKLVSPFRSYIDTNDLSTLGAAITNSLPVYGGLDDPNLDIVKPMPFEPVSKAIAPLDEDHFMKLVKKQIVEEEPSLVPLSKRRGMFYGNRRSHYLRPPVAPSLRYLKFRTPTIWLPEDDQELVKNINQYAYNWDLISSQMTNHHQRENVSNIERRTPWQCFERFVQLNEKFNIADMKGPRAHNAQVWLYEAHKLQQQQKRRISPLGVGSESIQRGHRRLRWASMFEAIRKCIKKRENAPRPNPSQPRKPLDVKNMSVPTPQEMSELKAQRDEGLKRDIQIKRAAKQRIQMAQFQQGKLPLTAASSPNLPVMHNGGSKDSRVKVRQSTPQSAPPLGEKEKVTTQTPSHRVAKPANKREIIEGYAKKILLQKPNFTPELALMAAENIYRSLPLSEQQRKAVSYDNGTVAKPRVPEIKHSSPTPQEILQRAQKK
ncbi:unnamed protein product [Kluyveromyces dobzhanskii CBS 2104]|uniref:Chromatin modification-related protein EAF1 n=1 Tax=Kluyveromyces dobzhanskii CBS 2104 TaxID=1427455 RepID=A0A0A8L7M7_9SACH|nr:unnamed protein product [Kluyveromyces dobzhanskii CBS 2104]